MVGPDYMLQSALRAYRRWRSLTSIAMLKALGHLVGVAVGDVEPDPEESCDPDIVWAFANHGSPMDGRL